MDKDPFDYQKPNDEQMARIEQLRAAFKVCRDALHATTLPSRAQSVALTKLEESAMWAVKSIVFE